MPQITQVHLQGHQTLVFPDTEAILDARENTLTIFQPEGTVMVFPWSNVSWYVSTPVTDEQLEEFRRLNAAQSDEESGE